MSFSCQSVINILVFIMYTDGKIYLCNFCLRYDDDVPDSKLLWFTL